MDGAVSEQDSLSPPPGPSDAAGPGAPPQTSGPPPSRDAAPPDDSVPRGAAVFETGVLHRIDITVADEHLLQLDTDQVNRVPCTVVYDGVTLAQSGIRKKGGRGSLRPLAQKPSFSIKFNEFVKGQKLAKLSKLLLNNSVQDPSFMNEHIGYELARKWGLAAPLTAHGLVAFNGTVFGIYVVREAINDDFLRRVFGAGNEDGNLYEGPGDFIRSPERLQLKDETEEMRSRADIMEFSKVTRATPDSRLVAVMSERFELAEAISAAALELNIGQWDGYFFNFNNYYLYNHPTRKRFVLIVVGMDAALNSNLDDWKGGSFLGQKVAVVPELAALYQAKREQFLTELNVEEVHARMDQAAAVIRSYTPTDRRIRAEYDGFEKRLVLKKNHIVTLKTTGKLPASMGTQLRPDGGADGRQTQDAASFDSR
jgi:spore coat protein H